ncbi:MAG: hypothetical protein KGI27_03875 [Thaumarchaeota archaeon]|nr:hypothetical protein [Nitrososphaerota archaeon]
MSKTAMSLGVSSLFLLTMVPAYAEVTSLQSDRTSYSVDMNVYFTGTVDSTDSQKLVNLLIQDPNGKIVLMTGRFAAQNDTFQIIINTNDPSQFHLKGTYKAVAFVDNESNGKTASFDFSPNGSPVIHQTSGSQDVSGKNTLQSVGLNHTSQLHENMTIVDMVNTSKITKSESNHAQSNGYDVESVLYPSMVACGAGIVGFIVYLRMQRSKTKSEQSKKSLSLNQAVDEKEDYALTVLKNRLAKGEMTLEEFKATRDALDEP